MSRTNVWERFDEVADGYDAHFRYPRRPALYASFDEVWNEISGSIARLALETMTPAEIRDLRSDLEQTLAPDLSRDALIHPGLTLLSKARRAPAGTEP